MSKHFEGMQRNKIDTDTKLDLSFKELRDRMGSLETSSAEYLEKGQNHNYEGCFVSKSST